MYPLLLYPYFHCYDPQPMCVMAYSGFIREPPDLFTHSELSIGLSYPHTHSGLWSGPSDPYTHSGLWSRHPGSHTKCGVAHSGRLDPYTVG